MRLLSFFPPNNTPRPNDSSTNSLGELKAKVLQRFPKRAVADLDNDPKISTLSEGVRGYIQTHLHPSTTEYTKSCERPPNDITSRIEEHSKKHDFELIHSSNIPDNYSGPIALLVADEHGSRDLYEKHMNLLSTIADDPSCNLQNGLFEYCTAIKPDSSYQDFKAAGIFKGPAFTKLREEQKLKGIQFYPGEDIEQTFNFLINRFVANSVLITMLSAQIKLTNESKDIQAIQTLVRERDIDLKSIGEMLIAVPEIFPESIELYQRLLARYTDDLGRNGIETGISVFDAQIALSNNMEIYIPVIVLNGNEQKAIKFTSEREAFIDVARELYTAELFKKFQSGLRPIIIGASHAESLTTILEEHKVPVLVISNKHINNKMISEFDERKEYFRAKRELYESLNV